MSIAAWAPLAKSPNWASHIVKASGLLIEYPYSYPKAAYSERCEFPICTNWSCPSLIKFFKKQYFYPVVWSTTTACLWENVPLSTSCPLNLIGYPILKMVANAIDYAVA